jgi:hypothetical protein
MYSDGSQTKMPAVGRAVPYLKGRPHLFVTKSVVLQRTESGAVLMDQATGNCFELNHIGAEIWKLLSEGATADAIAAQLSASYEVSQTVVAADVEALVLTLAQHGLVDPHRP